MKLLIDDANIEKIKRIYEYYAIDGVTTNPSILAKNGKNPYETLKEIREFIGKDAELHVQVVSSTAKEMVEEGHRIVKELGENTYVKIPATDVGLKATSYLSKIGVKITVTAILTAAQAMLASNAGASYVAPYVSRLENICADGIGTVADIAEIFSISGTDTEILAASFKTAKEVLDVAVVGCHAATVGSEIMHKLLSHTTTDSSIAGFASDWKNAFGNTTILQLIKK